MLSIIVPAYNVVRELGETVKKIVDTLEQNGTQYEVIIVNDGSNDGTDKESLFIQKQQRNVNVVGYDKNRGKGYALKYGFQFAHGDLVLFLDADSDLVPSQIPRFLEYREKDNADVVIGSKLHPLAQVNVSRSRRFLSKGYSLMIKSLFDLNVRDTQVGLKLFKRGVLERVMPKMMSKKYAYDVELLANARRLGHTVVEAPVELNYQLHSRISLKDIWVMFIDTIALFYRMKVLHHYDDEGKDA